MRPEQIKKEWVGLLHLQTNNEYFNAWLGAAPAQ